MSSAISTLANQARKALFDLIKKTTYLHYPPPYLMCKCFDALITPILEYGSQIQTFSRGDSLKLKSSTENFVNLYSMYLPQLQMQEFMGSWEENQCA